VHSQKTNIDLANTQEKLKVAMAMAYRSEGIGSISYVHPSGAWCSVIWDETGDYLYISV